MLRVTESASGLAIHYPLWLCLAFLAAGVALGVYVVRTFAWNGKSFGALAAAAICLFAGAKFLGYKVLLTQEQAVQRDWLGSDVTLRWSDVTQVTFEERASGRGGRTNYLVVRGAGDELAIAVSQIPMDDRAKVRDYVESRSALRH